MTFTPIDLNTWPRRDYFYYFTKMMPTGFNVTVDVDVTTTYAALKETGHKFFPAYLYLVTKLISQQPEFMVVRQGEQLGYLDHLTPSYSLFHEDDHTISGMWTAYDPDFETFYQSYLDDVAKYQNQHGAVAKPDQPVDAYMINLMPWLHFNSYTPLTFNGLPNYLPTIEAGQFQIKDGRRTMPVSFTIHHAVADGYHVSQFFEHFQQALNAPENWLN